MSSDSRSATVRRKLTPKQRVLRKYPHSGTELSAMWGWRVLDFGKDSMCSNVLSGWRATHKTEARAWYAAARRL